MHRPTTFKTFGPIKGSFWTPKLQKIKWNMISGTPCTNIPYTEDDFKNIVPN